VHTNETNSEASMTSVSEGEAQCAKAGVTRRVADHTSPTAALPTNAQVPATTNYELRTTNFSATPLPRPLFAIFLFGRAC